MTTASLRRQTERASTAPNNPYHRSGIEGQTKNLAFFLAQYLTLIYCEFMPQFRMTYGKAGIALTESFEAASGPVLVAYADKLANGKPTVGWGHTGPDVHVGAVWTYAQCVAALHADYAWAENVVNNLVTITVTQGEFDALVDFTFNVGADNFAKSTLLKDLNAGDIQGAADQFDVWDHASGKVVAGLLRRRWAETNLFTGGE